MGNINLKHLLCISLLVSCFCHDNRPKVLLCCPQSIVFDVEPGAYFYRFRSPHHITTGRGNRDKSQSINKGNLTAISLSFADSSMILCLKAGYTLFDCILIDSHLCSVSLHGTLRIWKDSDLSLSFRRFCLLAHW